MEALFYFSVLLWRGLGNPSGVPTGTGSVASAYRV